MKFLKSLKKNNKGFSLVELIIVIAIMAVLVGTLAPQYVRYVEKSRMAADATTIDNFISVLEVIAATPDSKINTGTKYTISFNAEGVVSYNNLIKTETDNGLDIFSELVDTTKTYTMKSSAYKAAQPMIVLEYKDNRWKTTLSGNNLPSSVN